MNQSTIIAMQHRIKAALEGVELLKADLKAILRSFQVASFIEDHKPHFTPNCIIEFVASYLELPKHEIMGRTKSERVVFARHTTIALMHECLGMSLLDIADEMDLDRTTVLHALNQTKNRIATNQRQAGIYAELRNHFTKN